MLSKNLRVLWSSTVGKKALMAVSGRPTVTVRRHDFDIHRVDQLVDRGVCDDLLAGFLTAAVKARANLIVAGGTGTGKTTMLRCLINEIDAEERLITVEDSLEIGLERFEGLHPDHETLEAREANTEGAETLSWNVRAEIASPVGLVNQGRNPVESGAWKAGSTTRFAGPPNAAADRQPRQKA